MGLDGRPRGLHQKRDLHALSRAVRPLHKGRRHGTFRNGLNAQRWRRMPVSAQASGDGTSKMGFYSRYLLPTIISCGCAGPALRSNSSTPTTWPIGRASAAISIAARRRLAEEQKIEAQ